MGLEGAYEVAKRREIGIIGAQGVELFAVFVGVAEKEEGGFGGALEVGADEIVGGDERLPCLANAPELDEGYGG